MGVFEDFDLLATETFVLQACKVGKMDNESFDLGLTSGPYAKKWKDFTYM